MLRTSLVVCLLSVPGFGIAQDCSCDRGIPFSGSYRVVFEEKTQRYAAEIVEVTSIDDGEPGTRIMMTGSGSSANMSCTGTEYHGSIQPIVQDLILRSTDEVGTSFGGLRMSDAFKGPVIRPGAVHSVPNEPNMPTLEFAFLDGLRQATPLMCERIKRSIHSAKIIQTAYADYSLMATAQSLNLAAHAAGKVAYPTLDVLLGTNSHYETASAGTYRDAVRRAYSPEMEGLITIELFENYASGIAGTNTATCEILEALPTNRDGTCRLEIELEAIHAHESVHSSRCDFMNKISDMHEAYSGWSNHPSNLSQDEVEAYQAALDLLEPWYAVFCEG